MISVSLCEFRPQPTDNLFHAVFQKTINSRDSVKNSRSIFNYYGVITLHFLIVILPPPTPLPVPTVPNSTCTHDLQVRGSSENVCGVRQWRYITLARWRPWIIFLFDACLHRGEYLFFDTCAKGQVSGTVDPQGFRPINHFHCHYLGQWQRIHVYSKSVPAVWSKPRWLKGL